MWNALSKSQRFVIFYLLFSILLLSILQANIPNIVGQPAPPTITKIKTLVDTKPSKSAVSKARILISTTISSKSRITNVSAVIQGPLPQKSTVGIVNLMLTKGTPLNGTWGGEFFFNPPPAISDGLYMVVVKANDTFGLQSQSSTVNIKLDTTPPVLKIPSSMLIKAIDPAGVIITFPTSAVDSIDGPILPICTPSSGNKFPIGINNVACSAVDKTGNMVRKAFTITVAGNKTSPSIVFDKEVYNLGATALIKGTAPQSSNVTIHVLDAGRKAYVDGMLHPSINGSILFPIHIAKDAKPGKWLTEVTVGNSTQRLGFEVKRVGGMSGAIIPQKLVRGELLIKNSKNNTLLSFKNTGNLNISSLLIKVGQGNIPLVSAEGWESHRLSNNTVIITTKKPLEQGQLVNITTKLMNMPKLPLNMKASITPGNNNIGPIFVVPSVGPPVITTGPFITLSIIFMGNGMGTIDFILPHFKECNSTFNRVCLLTFRPDEIFTSAGGNVYLIATPDRGSFFEGWGGGCSPNLGGEIPYPDESTGYYDRDATCIVTFTHGPVIHINIEGGGIGAVFSDTNGIKCATGGTGDCSSLRSTSGTALTLSAVAASESSFTGWSGNCSGSEINIQVTVDSDKTCTATFEPEPNISHPSEIPIVDPEFIRVSRILADRQGIDIGWPISADNSGPALSHFQFFKTGDSPHLNPAEMYTVNPLSSSHSTCVSVAFTDPKSPDWYDEYMAIEEGTFPYRHWAGDDRSLADISTTNKNSDGWSNTYPAFGSNGSPFPQGRGNAPNWFTRCMSENDGQITMDIPFSTQPSVNPGGAPCGGQVSDLWHNSLFGNGPPEWALIQDPNSSGWPGFSWVPMHATGVIINDFLSKHDASPSHGAAPDGYWLGLPPGPFASNGENCRTGDVGWDLCNDLVIDLRPDPQSKFLLNPQQRENLDTEIEQWLIPQGYRPEPGDRVDIMGRWIVDCGHNDFHAELHPMELVVSSYLQTSPLDITHPNDDFSHGSTFNMPMIASQWQEITQEHPATVNKIVITSDWQGEELTFDLWPPPRPSAMSTLRWSSEPGLIIPSGILSWSPDPVDNPNHLHVTISQQPDRLNGGCGLTGPVLGEVCAKIDRRIVDAFLLWWEG